jgi:DNA-binding winged helix-turn-helix (wHTH) protein/Tfp pilus assembly protein PilF
MGDFKHDGLAVPGRVDLAHERPFVIGGIRVDPPTRQLIAGDQQQTLEPKVMQVLVALFRAEGAVVSRDELIDWCWDGRIVGDDALNRVIGRIRSLAAGIAAGSFSVETIPRVGYRLTGPGLALAEQQPAPTDAAKAPLDRRKLLVAGGATAIAAGVGAIVWRPWRHRPAPEAVELFRRGDLAQRAGTNEQSRQSITYFENAVRVDPLYAQGWGALAMAYTHNLEGYGEAEHSSLPNRIRSAAARALDLDPNNADAMVALACIKPFFRNWAESETQLRRICDRFPDHWLAHGRLGVCLYQTGRFSDGAALHQRVIEIDPMIVVPYAFATRALAANSRIQEADALLAKALERWPAHRILWYSKIDLLLFTGRPAAAAGFMANPETLPSGIEKEEVDFFRSIASAVESGSPDESARLARELTGILQASTLGIPFTVPYLALLGHADTVFASLERYLLDRGPFGKPAPIASLGRRHTDMLFLPPMASIWRDPRFAALLRAIGLDRYWQSTGTRPDYLRS